MLASPAWLAHSELANYEPEYIFWWYG